MSATDTHQALSRPIPMPTPRRGWTISAVQIITCIAALTAPPASFDELLASVLEKGHLSSLPRVARGAAVRRSPGPSREQSTGPPVVRSPRHS